MDFHEWEPVYCKILEEFKFSRRDDELSARLLNTMVEGKRICKPECLEKIVHHRVTVYGYGPNLENELENIRPIGTLISADGATSILMKKGIIPDIIVTDLDGDIKSQIEANLYGSIAVIHAHGDNIERIREALPFFEGWITPTTQSEPFGNVYNFGGFTDGDRAVVLARHFGASQIYLVGFDFNSVREQRGKDSRIKVEKLKWARRIIFELNPPTVSLLIP